MSFAEDSKGRRESLGRLGRIDPEAYARRRLGTMLDDSWVRGELEGRLEAGWEPIDAVNDVSHQVPWRMVELLLDATGPDGTILDWGCGKGSFVNFGRDYACVPNSVVAVDAEAPDEPFPWNVRFFQSDLRAFEWDGPSFDMALALHVFGLVPDSPGLAAKLRGLLRTGAKAMVAVPEGRWIHSLLKEIWKGERSDEVDWFTFDGFNALMEEAGFELEGWTCWPAYHSIHFGHVELPDGRSLGEILDRLAADFDRANGTQSFSCYGYALAYVAR